MTIYQIFPQIRDNSIFSNVNPDSVNQYLTKEVMSVLDFQEKSTIYSSASDLKKVGIVIDGKAFIQTGAPGDHTLLNTIERGDMFGIANLYAEADPFPTVIVAANTCRILFIDSNAFCKLIEQDSIATKNFLAFQSKKIMYLNKKIMTFTAGSAEKKLAVFILDHEINQVFSPPCSMSTLANMLGIGRASLYRALDHLIEQGWIEKQQKNIVIRDPESLASFL